MTPTKKAQGTQAHAAPDSFVEAIAARAAEHVVERIAELLPEPDREPPALLDRAALARALACSTAQVDRLTRDGLPFLRVGEVRRYQREVVMRWLEQRTAERANDGTLLEGEAS